MPMRKRLPILALLLATAFFTAAFLNGNAQPPIPNPQIQESLEELAWLDLSDVKYSENTDDSIELVIYYTTSETDMVALRAEMLEIFRAVGLIEADLAADRVSLVPLIPINDTTEQLEVATITTGTLRRFAVGDITRSQFLERLEIMPLEHQSRTNEDPA